MLELLAIGQALNAVKTAADLIRMAPGTTGRAKVGEDTVKLTEHILSIQKALLAANDEQAALVQTINDLKDKIASKQAWQEDMGRYDLVPLLPRVFVYSLREECANGEHPHNICQKCRQNGKKSILNESAEVHGVRDLSCPECGTVLKVGIYDVAAHLREQTRFYQELGDKSARHRRRGL
jgi:hypothetical protein